MMRICKLLPVADGLRNWGPVHEELLAEIASPDVHITQLDLPNCGVLSIGSSLEADLVAPDHTRAAMRAEAEGFDAVAMGCLFEPGVSAAKEALRIPVVGEAGAAMHLAAMLAPTFGWLVPGQKPGGTDRRILELASAYGFAGRLVTVRRVNATSLSFAGRLDRPVLSEMHRQAEAALAEDGAAAIIGYGGLEAYSLLRRELGVPVISPIQASILVAEMLVRGKLAHSKAAYARPASLD